MNNPLTLHRPSIVQFLLGCLAVAFLTSCASVEKDTSPPRVDRAEPGKALVIFYRESKLVGSAVGFDVRDNGVKIGGLPNGSFFAYQATPGEHTFSAATENTDESVLTVEPAKTYYIRGSIEMGVWVGRPNLMIMNADEGKSASRGLKRVKLQQ